MLGLYQNFPQQIHLQATFTSALGRQGTQQRIAKALHDVNGKEFTFEQIGNPAVPHGTVIFMFGIADADGFKFLNDAQAQKLLTALAEEPMETMDWFLAIRYYKNTQPKRTPLKFDYYVLRLAFGEKETLQMVVSHERGPRYISPEDLAAFIEQRINGASKKKTLKRVET